MTEQPPSDQAQHAALRGDVPALLAFWLALRPRPKAGVEPRLSPDLREALR
jgi:hypothetical protein